jgi:4'-phosphopantetheinyl transferase
LSKAAALSQALHREAHVWQLVPESVTDAALLARCAAELSGAEQARHARFKFARDRHLFLLSHALVRRVLSSYAEVEPAAWQFSAGPHGRPEIAAPALDTALRFNLTHTDGLIACVVTNGADCGIDAEKLRLPGNPEGIADKLFAASEREALAQLSGAAYVEAFFTYWTLREAYCKATGLGLSQAMAEFAFERAPDPHFSIRFEPPSTEHSANWQFTRLSPDPQHVLAIALRSRPTGGTLAFRLLSAADLFESSRLSVPAID